MLDSEYSTEYEKYSYVAATFVYGKQYHKLSDYSIYSVVPFKIDLNTSEYSETENGNLVTYRKMKIEEDILLKANIIKSAGIANRLYLTIGDKREVIDDITRMGSILPDGTDTWDMVTKDLIRTVAILLYILKEKDRYHIPLLINELPNIGLYLLEELKAFENKKVRITIEEI